MTERISNERLAKLAEHQEMLVQFGPFPFETTKQYLLDMAAALRELQELRKAAEMRALDNAMADQMIDRMTDDEVGLGNSGDG